jgi:hypothetical protein
MIVSYSVLTRPPCNGGYGILQANVMNGFLPFSYLFLNAFFAVLFSPSSPFLFLFIFILILSKYEWIPAYDTGQTIRVKATVNYDVEYIFQDSLLNFVDLSTPIVESFSSESTYLNKNKNKNKSKNKNKIFILFSQLYLMEVQQLSIVP